MENESRNVYFEKALRTPTKKKPAPFVERRNNGKFVFVSRIMKKMVSPPVLVLIISVFFGIVLLVSKFENWHLHPPLNGKYDLLRMSISCKNGYDLVGGGFCIPKENRTVRYAYYLGLFLAPNLHEPSFQKYCIGESTVVTKTKEELENILVGGGLISIFQNKREDGLLTPGNLIDEEEFRSSFEVMIELWKSEKRWEIEYTELEEVELFQSSKFVDNSILSCLKGNIEDIIHNLIYNIITKLLSLLEKLRNKNL